MTSKGAVTNWQRATPPRGVAYLLRSGRELGSASLQRLNSLNAELIPICYLLALLGAHHFLHVSRIRVKLLILR